MFFFKTTYEGKDEARGINVEKWSSCIYLDEIKGLVKATWTWTDPDSWTTVKKDRSFPVEMVVEYALESGIQTIERYEYTSYNPYIRATPDIFEVTFLYSLMLVNYKIYIISNIV